MPTARPKPKGAVPRAPARRAISIDIPQCRQHTLLRLPPGAPVRTPDADCNRPAGAGARAGSEGKGTLDPLRVGSPRMPCQKEPRNLPGHGYWIPEDSLQPIRSASLARPYRRSARAAGRAQRQNAWRVIGRRRACGRRAQILGPRDRDTPAGTLAGRVIAEQPIVSNTSPPCLRTAFSFGPGRSERPGGQAKKNKPRNARTQSQRGSHHAKGTLCAGSPFSEAYPYAARQSTKGGLLAGARPPGYLRKPGCPRACRSPAACEAAQGAKQPYARRWHAVR